MNEAEFNQKIVDVINKYDQNNMFDGEKEAIADHIITLCGSDKIVRSAWFFELSITSSCIPVGDREKFNKYRDNGFMEDLCNVIETYVYDVGDKEIEAIGYTVIEICGAEPHIRSLWYYELAQSAIRISKGINNFIDQTCVQNGIRREDIIKDKVKIEN